MFSSVTMIITQLLFIRDIALDYYGKGDIVYIVEHGWKYHSPVCFFGEHTTIDTGLDFCSLWITFTTSDLTIVQWIRRSQQPSANPAPKMPYSSLRTIIYKMILW
jgi:hypothetical protein